MNHKSYLGDGVYIREGAYLGEAILTTEEGSEATNSVSAEIHLEPDAIRRLQRWLDAMVNRAMGGDGSDG